MAFGFSCLVGQDRQKEAVFVWKIYHNHERISSSRLKVLLVQTCLT